MYRRENGEVGIGETLMVRISRKRELALYQENQSRSHSLRRGAATQVSSNRANAVREQKRTRRGKATEY